MRLRTPEVGRAAVALGSNLGDRERNLRTAVGLVGGLGLVTAVSGFWSTAPVGYLDQPDFLNAALVVETRLGPMELLEGLLGIELRMGRVRVGVPSKGPRVIDLDLLLYGGEVVRTAVLTVPHPAMQERGFVLGPLGEIAGDWVHPVMGVTVGALLRRLEGAG